MQGFNGKKNIYLCPDCGHGFVTKDCAEGVTPFMTQCLICGSFARSMMYNIPQELLGTPAIRWIRPKKEVWGKLSAGLQQHLEKGGLIRDDTKGLPGNAPKKKAFRP